MFLRSSLNVTTYKERFGSVVLEKSSVSLSLTLVKLPVWDISGLCLRTWFLWFLCYYAVNVYVIILEYSFLIFLLYYRLIIYVIVFIGSCKFLYLLGVFCNKYGVVLRYVLSNFRLHEPAVWIICTYILIFICSITY